MSKQYPGGFIIKNPTSPTSSVASGIWTIDQAMQYTKAKTWPTPEALPPVSGYIGLYTTSSFVAGVQWTDKSGNGNHATLGGTPTVVNSTVGNGSTLSFPVVQGSTSSTVVWPTTILPSTYTLFHVARYNGAEKRIFNGSGNNWLSGFWDGAAGVAFHEGWLTGTSDIHGTNWVYSTDQNSLYRSNGVLRGSSGGSASTRLTINAGNFSSELSDWQVAEVIVYNTTLSSTDYLAVESYLKTKYGL